MNGVCTVYVHVHNASLFVFNADCVELQCMHIFVHDILHHHHIFFIRKLTDGTHCIN